MWFKFEKSYIWQFINGKIMKFKLLIFTLLLFFLKSVQLNAQVGTATGRLVSKESNMPVAGVSVSESSGKKISVTDADGKFKADLAAGKQMLIFDKPDYEQVIKPVVIKAGETIEIGQIEMSAMGVESIDLSAMNSNEQVSEDGFETQSIQGILSSSSDIFLSTAAYTFGPMMFRVRGYDANYQNVSINGFVVNDIESGNPYFSNWGGLNDVLRNAMVSSGPEPIGFLFEPVGGATRINTRASEYRSGVKSVYSLSNRTYRNRAMITYSTGLLKNNWAITGSFSRRWSEQGYEPGTFYDANSYFLSVEKKLSPKHSLNLTALNAVYNRGVAGGSTQEAYDLAGSNYYNPYWGYQNGEVRNSRVRSNNRPLITLLHLWEPSKSVNVQTTVGYWFGNSGYTALNWYDVLDPRPDYYRKLPSYYTNAADQARISELWKNVTTSQVDWDHFYMANRKNIYTVNNANGVAGNSISGNRSKYIVEDRRNDISQFQFNSRFSWDINAKINLKGGLLADIYRGHNYNVVDDLLGGDYWLDIDQFAERDYPNNPDAFQNDLKQTNRVVKTGNTFGNSYYLFQQSATAWGLGHYSGKRWSAYLGAESRITSLWREGLMQKGLFPDNSFGPSKKMNFITWGVKAGGDYRITGRHMLNLNAMISTNPPLPRNSFLSPRTRNSMVDNLNAETIISADASYILRAPNLKGRITGYYTRFNNQTEVTSFYHDEWRTLVNYSMTGIDKENYGIEVGAEAEIFTGFSINGVASLGQYLWVSNPSIAITKDNNSEVLSNEEVWIQYFRQSSSPQTALACGIEYNSSHFWWAGVTASWYDNIYLDFNPVTRTKDETGYYPYWDTQQKANPGFIVDIFAGKSWKIDNYYIGLSANLSNVLNNKSVVTGGYEQYRFDPERPELFQPKIYYSNGFNYFINLSFRF